MNVIKVNYNAKEAPLLFTESLLNTGFAIITGHSISPKLIREVYAEWRAFFASEYKYNYVYDRIQYDGYYPMCIGETAKGCEIKDIKEFFHVYPTGKYPRELSDRTKKLYQELSDMACVLLQWIEESLPADIAQALSMPLQKMIIDSPRTTLRVLHYPPITGSEDKGAIRAAPHEDINLLTLLLAATESGLQLQDTHGYWHDIPSDMDDIVVNVGNILDICTKGHYRATLHRVVNPSNTKDNVSRFSMPLFLHPRDEVNISEGYTAGQYLKKRLTESYREDN